MSFVAAELRDLGTGEAFFDALAGMTGETYRQVASRRTFRFEHRGRAYFAKVHFGVGWREIVKNLVTLRLPVLGASNEWRAIRRLESLGIATMTPVAFVDLGWNPASKRSAVVTRELTDTISLEDLALERSVTGAERRALVERVARITHDMHAGGVNHRDLYICHFHLRHDPLSRGRAAFTAPLYVIDLHRAQLRSRTPERWRIKDVAALFFSTFDAGLTQRDYLRFLRGYSRKSLKRTLSEDRAFWRGVVKRACRLYRAESGRVPRHIEAMLNEARL